MKVLNRLLRLLQQIINKLESSQVGLVSWLIVFFSFVFLRNFLDSLVVFSNPRWQFFFLHAPALYLALFLCFILLNYFLTKERIEKISRISLWTAPLLLLPPLIELFVFRGAVVIAKYNELAPRISGIKDFLGLFFKYMFFNPNGLLYFGGSSSVLSGLSADVKNILKYNYGLRIELNIILLFFLFYIFFKTRSVWKVFLGLGGAYLIFFVMGYFPYFFTTLLGLPNSSASFHNVSKLNPGFEWNYILFALYFILIFILATAWFYIYDKKKLIALVKNLRIFRIGLYLGALYYGIYLAQPTWRFGFFDWLIIILASLAVVFSWLFAVGSNDLMDEQADKMNKPERPLPSGVFARSEVKSLNIIFRIVSYVCALVAGYGFFITILVRSAISYLYSNPPFRLKKIPLVATFCIAGGVLLGVMGGYLLLSDNSLYNFPVKLAGLILAVLTLSTNVIHLKDERGDKQDQVWTIPVIFGLARGKKIVGWLTAVSFLIPPVIYFEHCRFLIIPSLICAGLSYYLINRQNFKEWPVFLLYCFYTIPVALYLY